MNLWYEKTKQNCANSETSESSLFKKIISLYEIVTLTTYRQRWGMNVYLTGEETRCKAVIDTSHAITLIQNYFIYKKDPPI